MLCQIKLFTMDTIVFIILFSSKHLNCQPVTSFNTSIEVHIFIPYHANSKKTNSLKMSMCIPPPLNITYLCKYEKLDNKQQLEHFYQRNVIISCFQIGDFRGTSVYTL